MKQILQLVLVTVVAVGCASSDKTRPDGHSTADSPATFEVSPEDGAPADSVAPQPADGNLDAGGADRNDRDTPISADRNLDTSSVDRNDRDTPISADGNPDTSSVDRNDGDTPITADGSSPVIDARTVVLPDGRKLTYLDVCQLGPLRDSDPCPKSYALGLAAAEAKLQSPPDGGRPAMPGDMHTGAGRCAEGSYVYGPFLDLSGEVCYYDAATQLLVGHEYDSDYPIECGQMDMLSNVLVQGNRPACSKITWEVYGIVTRY